MTTTKKRYRPLIGEQIPARPICWKDGRIWRVRLDRGHGYSGSWEGALQQMRRQIAKREAFFAAMQARGKDFS